MIGGTTQARRPVEARHNPPIMAAPTIEALPPPMVECTRCDTPAVLFAAGRIDCSDRDPDLPKGWLLMEGRPFCPDCVSAMAPSAENVTVIGPADGEARYRGLRISHQIVLDAVGLRIEGGARRYPGERGDPVQTMLTVPDIDKLIAHLKVIRVELVASAKDMEARRGH